LAWQQRPGHASGLDVGGKRDLVVVGEWLVHVHSGEISRYVATSDFDVDWIALSTMSRDQSME
jgi:hypothetical protein